jgi:chemotaxis protein MotB
MAGRDKNGRGRPVIIKKEEVVEGGHHGGAWKVAYADFVTAMMAFFLLMWLLNATTEAQRKGLADYFTPMNAVSRNQSGNGQPFGGHTPYDQGELASDRGAASVITGRAPPPPLDDQDGDTPVQQTPQGPSDQGQGHGQSEDRRGEAMTRVEQTGDSAPGGGSAARQAPTATKAELLANAGAGTAAHTATAQQQAEAEAAAAQQERIAFQQAAKQIQDAVRNDPALADLSRQLAIDITPDGLRIQLLDEEHRAMFATGSATLNDRAELLLHKIAPVLAKLTEPLAITGHTDAAPYKGTDRSNWELSADRANATRRLLADAGLPETRFREVSGRADHDLLLPADPMAAANRRIAILVVRTAHPP